jgi:WD40 repeat protein
MWDAASGEVIGEALRGHTDIVLSVAFSPDGKQVVSGSEDCTIRLWDVESVQAIQEPLQDLCQIVEPLTLTDGVWVKPSSNKPIWLSDKDSERGMISDDSVLDRNGWMRTPSGELLFWVPLMNRDGLFRRNTRLIIGAKPTRITLHQFVCGAEWTNVRRKFD